MSLSEVNGKSQTELGFLFRENVSLFSVNIQNLHKIF